MSVRLKALLVVFLFAAACTPEQAAAPPPSARTSQQMAMLSDGGVPANRWRVVLIAGDNNSPAFDNGVEAMRAKLVARGVRDIRALTSDPGANPSLPVATAANVSSALRTAGGEACLAFITSHGDESGFVLKQARGTVSPATLDNALDAGCGARPTVVVVSACHSGVFLTSSMRQPNRIVLAAAAPDRASFGCGAGDQYTYFDQCLLQQFDGVATWQQLAATTKVCVENLERKMGIRRPSLPQTFVGSAVADLRIPGR
jgi:peptidase C13-like protein